MIAFWRSRRRQLLVDKRLQLPFATMMLGVMALLTALLMGFGLYLDSRLRSLARGRLEAGDLPELAARISGSSRLFIIWLALAFLLIIAVEVVYTLHVSRKLAGPLLRLRRMLAEVARGSTSQRAMFRRRDYQGELARAVNTRMSWIDDCNARLKAGIPFLGAWLQSIRTAIELKQLPLDDSDLHDFEATVRGIAEAWQLRGQAASKEARPAAPAGRRARVRRRRLLVDRRLQFRFIALLLIQMGLSFVLIAGLTRFHMARMHHHLEALPVATEAEAEGLDERVMALVNRFYLGTTALGLMAAAATAGMGLKLSHRLVGPLVRLRQHLALPLAETRWSPIAFRKSDGLGGFTRQLNSAAEAFEEHRQSVLATLQELLACIRALREVDSLETAHQMSEDMKELVRQLTSGIEMRDEH